MTAAGTGAPDRGVRVWDPLVRILHWSLATSVIVAYFTHEGPEIVHNAAGYAAPFLTVEDPAFYEAAVEGKPIELDLATGVVTLAGRAFRAQEPSRIIRALASEGGIVPAIQHHGTAVFEKLTA